MLEFEKNIIIFLNRPKSKTLDLLSTLVSSVPLLVTIWIAIGIFLILHDLLEGLFVSLGLTIVFMIHFFISEGIFKWGGKIFSLERLRPYRAYPNEVRAIGKKFLDASFPSSHMASLVGGLIVLSYFYRSIIPLAIVLVLIMGWSRIRNGMHYPSDILAGILLGLLYGYLTLAILRII